MPDFNGDTLTITLDAGLFQVRVIEDLFVPWKNWMLASPNNRKYPAAFRSDGGANLTALIKQGQYIFLNNTAGWRIKPPEANGTYYLIGNLAVEDTDLDAFIPTTGGFTAAVLGLQPITQGVTQTLIDRLNFNAFSGGVSYDAVNGDTQANYTLAGVTIPGSVQYPVNNLADALAIQAQFGLPKVLYVVGDLDAGAGDTVTGWKIVGTTTDNHLHLDPGSLFTDCAYENCHIHGDTYGESTWLDCHLMDLTGMDGMATRCMFGMGTKTLAVGANLHMVQCSSALAGEMTPTFDCNGNGVIQARGYTGGIKLTNKTSGEASVDLTSGQCVIDATCTGGGVSVRGTGKLVNNGAGISVRAVGLSAEDVNSVKMSVESARSTHQGYGVTYFVDPSNGLSTNDGLTEHSALTTYAEAEAKCADGGNDVIQFVNSGVGVVTHAEDIVMSKSDVHLRCAARDIVFKPAVSGGSVITVNGDNCSIESLLIDGDKDGATTANYCITVNGRFCALNHVWAKQAVLDCVLFRGGDYHTIVDGEIEKAGRHGVATVDAALPSGSPREISIYGRTNIYLNGGNGIDLGDDGVGPKGSTTRIVRVLSGEITANTGFGVAAAQFVDALTLGNALVVHGNNGGHDQPQTSLLTDEVHDDQEERTHAVWKHIIEANLSAEELMRVMVAAMAGKLSGADTTNPIFRDLADSKNRINATVDGQGNRTAVSLDVS